MSAPVRPIPIWLSLLLILLCLGGGVSFMWWYFNGDALAGRTVIIPNDVLEKERAARAAAVPRPQRNAFRANDVDGIRPDSGSTTGANATGRWSVKGGDAFLVVQGTGNAPVTLRYRYSYVRNDLLNPDQFKIVVATRRLANDNAMAKAVGISEEQQNKLRADSTPIGIVMSDADRARIEALFVQYLASATDAERQKAEKQVVAALTEVGKQQLEPTKQKLVERIDRVRALITPEQWEAWKKVGGG